jgi:hypothetical protein
VGIDITGEIGRRVMSQYERLGRGVGAVAAAGAVDPLDPATVR